MLPFSALWNLCVCQSFPPTPILHTSALTTISSKSGVRPRLSIRDGSLVSKLETTANRTPAVRSRMSADTAPGATLHASGRR